MCNVLVHMGSPHNSIYANLQSLGSYTVKYSMHSLRETNKTDLEIVGCWVVGRRRKGVVVVVVVVVVCVCVGGGGGGVGGDLPGDVMVTISLMACKRRFVDSFLAPSYK